MLFIPQKEIIARHLEVGMTKKDALQFIKSIQTLYDQGKLTEDEANSLFKSGTLDCISVI